MAFIDDLLEYTQWNEIESDESFRRMFSRERYSSEGRYHHDRFDLLINHPKRINEIGFVCYQQTREQEEKIRAVYKQNVVLPYQCEFEEELSVILLDFKRRAQKYGWF